MQVLGFIISFAGAALGLHLCADLRSYGWAGRCVLALASASLIGVGAAVFAY